MELITNSRNRVHLIDVHVAVTCANVLAGTPDSAYFHRKIRSARSMAQERFGTVPPVVMLMPRSNVAAQSLPAFCYTMLFDSASPAGTDYDGSHLVVIWFTNTGIDGDFHARLDSKVKSLDWSTLARKYNL